MAPHKARGGIFEAMKQQVTIAARPALLLFDALNSVV